ncbi:DUF932 domain-containing protein [Nonomuraea sp. NPDC050663]|uniref:DUF932 domain-containing protein n=1 Tax=Nonomuraea sp. NPDC050663 TaxID=3364370 RepID=UPI0037AA9F6B
MTATMPALTTRNANLEDLVDLLRAQRARQIDLVLPASHIHAQHGQLILPFDAPLLTPDGVSQSGMFRPTAVCDDGLAEKLKIPRTYLRRLREERLALYDANLNGWLADDPRRFLIRTLRGEDGNGVARALLSDSYRIIDNLDVLTSILDGIRTAEVPVNIAGCDLTERRMYVRIACEQIAVHAPRLMSGYRSPFTGAEGTANPLVFAGFVVSNSETGCGAFSVTPRLIFSVCDNGATFTADALRNVHLGGRLDEGQIQWSHDTQRKNLELIAAKTRDAVTTFLSRSYVEAKITEMEQQAGALATHAPATIERVAKKLAYSQETQDEILAHFIRGGQLTAGGVMHAVTSVAQTLPNPDARYAMEADALQALQLAAAGV